MGEDQVQRNRFAVLLASWGCAVWSESDARAPGGELPDGATSPHAIVCVDPCVGAESLGFQALMDLCRRLHANTPACMNVDDTSTVWASEARALGLVLLESPAQAAPLRALFTAYSKRLMPWQGGLASSRPAAIRVFGSCHGGLGAIFGAEIPQYGADVGFDCFLRKVEFSGDIAIGLPVHDAAQNLFLASRERTRNPIRTGFSGPVNGPQFVGNIDFALNHLLYGGQKLFGVA